MLEYQLQLENYWMKTFRTVQFYDLNERINFMKIFSPFSRFDKGFIGKRTRFKKVNY